MKLNNKELRKIINACYKTCMNEYMGVYTDSDWSHVYDLARRLQYVKYVDDINLSSGTYYNYIGEDGNLPYRDYTVTIETRYGNIKGYIRCCSAGTKDDPFSKYDMLLALWPADATLTEGKEQKDYTFSKLIKKFAECRSVQEVKAVAKKYAREGIMAATILSAILMGAHSMENLKRQLIEREVYNMEIEYYDPESMEIEAEPEWIELCNDVETTVYNAKKEQCNKDVSHTASMFELDLQHPEQHRIIAMERTMMKQYGLHYGDIVKLEGAGSRSGVYQIQDTMNKRFADKHKVDIMVDNNTHLGEWENVRIYKLANIDNKDVRDSVKADMKPAKNQERMDAKQYALYDTSYEMVEKLNFNDDLSTSKLNEALAKLDDGDIDLDTLNQKKTVSNKAINNMQIKYLIQQYLYPGTNPDPEVIINDLDVSEEMKQIYTVYDIMNGGNHMDWPQQPSDRRKLRTYDKEISDLRIAKYNNLAFRVLVNDSDIYVLKYNKWRDSNWVTAIPQPVLQFCNAINISGYIETTNLNTLSPDGTPDIIHGVKVGLQLYLFTMKNWKGKNYYLPKANEPMTDDFKISHNLAANFPDILNRPAPNATLKPTALYQSQFESADDFRLVMKKVVDAGFSVIDEFGLVYDAEDMHENASDDIEQMQNDKVEKANMMHDKLISILGEDLVQRYKMAKDKIINWANQNGRKPNFYASVLCTFNRKQKNIYKKLDRNVILEFVKSNTDFDNLKNICNSKPQYKELLMQYDREDDFDEFITDYLVNRFFCKLINKCVNDKPNGWQKEKDLYNDPFDGILKEVYLGPYRGYAYETQQANMSDMPLAINTEQDLYYLIYDLGYAVTNAYKEKDIEDTNASSCMNSAASLEGDKEPNLNNIDFTEIKTCLSIVFNDIISK